MPHQSGRNDLRSLLRLHATETGLGLAMLALAVMGELSPWLVPVAIALLLSVPLAALVQTKITFFQHLGDKGRS